MWYIQYEDGTIEFFDSEDKVYHRLYRNVNKSVMSFGEYPAEPSNDLTF